MIVRITGYKGFRSVVAVHAGPDAQWVMGRFPEARWNPAERVYVVRETDVEHLVAAFADEPGAIVLDERESDWSPPPYTRRTFTEPPGDPTAGAAACRLAMAESMRPADFDPGPDPETFDDLTEEIP